jgi:rod shape determining protein RodA
LQPDLSNAVLYIPIVLSIFYLSGVDRTFLLSLISFVLITAILFLTKIYFSLSNISTFSKFVNILYLALSGSVKELFITIFVIFSIILIIWWVIKNLKFELSNIYLYLTFAIIILSFISVIFGSKVVKMYQQKRIIAFIKPNAAPSDAGYQVIQTRIAIGSGRLFGRGLFKGTQTQLGFVPEKHTDFIFSLIAEEFGFIGASLVILLYTIIILQGVNIMLTSRDSFGSLVACGITSLFSFYLTINIGMCLGILPVIGLPLPFVSYGGSNLVSSFMAIGLLNSIHLRKFIY